MFGIRLSPSVFRPMSSHSAHGGAWHNPAAAELCRWALFLKLQVDEVRE
jgi:hypothetical protein